jgi:SAM-dependent methyltransferase
MDAIKAQVRHRYAQIARGAGSCCGPAPADSSSCCTPNPREAGRPSKAASDGRLIDYGALADQVVPGSDLGLGCGLPTRHARLAAGETVLDLGSGAGVDVLLAAQQVGPSGRAIGVDMTPEMLSRAWDNAARSGLRNVDFRLGDLEALPVADASVDVVLSNCVINLVPDKSRAFAELFRVLRPGGRFVISDMVVRSDAEQWAGCIAGAMERDAYLGAIRKAGFTAVQVHDEVEYDQYRGEGYVLLSITVEGHKA